MSSRLDRLLLLLESGSTASIRKSAAEQLGEVQKLYPHELNSLLNKVHIYLMSSQWETRVAASQAISAIISSVLPWNPIGQEENNDESASCDSMAGQMTLKLSHFNLSKVLAQGVQLTTRDHRAFDQFINTDGVIDSEMLAEQKRLLNKKLGLDIPILNSDYREEAIGDDLVNESDLILESSCAASHVVNVKDFVEGTLRNNQIIIQEGDNHNTNSNELIENNSLGRKRKNLESHSEPLAKSVKIEENDASVDTEEGILSQWPLSNFCNLLANNLFDAVWERRHGAALGLKVLIKQHGSSAGKSINLSSQQMLQANSLWLQDLSVRLICVLSLDRLGDYLTDEVIAPVRESCAQVLGVVCLHLKEPLVVEVVHALLQLLSSDQNIWEVKHGGLLGIKYILASRQDLSGVLLERVLGRIYEGLVDKSDDVRSVAASSLLPVVDQLVRLIPAQVGSIIDSLWSTLRELDELSSSTNSVMHLISLLTSHPHIYHIWKTSSLSQLVPLLYPFISHSITSVRKASLTTMNTLLNKSTVAAYSDSCATSVDDATNIKLNLSTSEDKCGWVQCGWVLPLLHHLARLIFQRSLLENDPAILACLQQVWDKVLLSCSSEAVIQQTGHCFKHWCCLLMQPDNVHYENESLINVSPNRGGLFRCIGGVSNGLESVFEKDKVVVRARLTAASLLGKYCFKVTHFVSMKQPEESQPQQNQQPATHQTHQQPAQEIQHPPPEQSQQPPNSNQLTAAIELGQLLSSFLTSKSFIQRFVASNIIYFWAKEATLNNVKCGCPSFTIDQLKSCLGDPVYFDELAFMFTRLQSEAKSFISTLHSWDIKLGGPFDDISTLLTLEKMQLLCQTVTQQEDRCVRGHLSGQSYEIFKKLKLNLQSSLTVCSQTKYDLTNRVQCSIASVLTELHQIEGLFNPTIRPLIQSIKTEHNKQLQEISGLTLSKLVMLVRHMRPCPSAKVVKNLVNLLLLDRKLKASIDKDGDHSSKFEGILVLKTRQDNTSIKVRRPYRKQNQAESRDSSVESSNSDADKLYEEANEAAEAQTRQQERESVQRRGSRHALCCMVLEASAFLHSHVPTLHSIIFDTFQHTPLLEGTRSGEEMGEKPMEHLVKCLHVLHSVLPSLHVSAKPELTNFFPHLLTCLSNKYSIVRHLASCCLATISGIETFLTIDTIVIGKLLSRLCNSMDDYERMGAIEAISMIIEHLNIEVVPYIVSLVLPLLGAMSDCNSNVRLVATYSFAVLVRLMPLDNEIGKEEAICEDITKKVQNKNQDEKIATNNTHKHSTESKDNSNDIDITVNSNNIAKCTSVLKGENYFEDRKKTDRGFLQQLLNPKLIQQFVVPIPLNVQLRQYQQDGINWLSFLSTYKLHGILCDDMGLGKTLQALCIVISDYYNNQLQASKGDSTEGRAPSIVITPPTLTSHWLFEVQKVTSCDVIRPLHYVGIPAERLRLQKQIGSFNLVLASYDVVRNDIEFLSKIKWNYCILDEGHIIKNNKTKMSKAIKQLPSQHRLVLSGTPIQNNVLELWSLFDFLMPGFLGDEKQFQATFGRPILQSRDSKSSSKEQEAGALALEALHRQVLPFMLRRLKEDVLKDLPPKIMQDYYCDLSPLQVQLYEDFSRLKKDSIQSSNIEDDDDEEEKGANKEDENIKIKKNKKKEKVSHIFQALQYLRKVCNHPSLAMGKLPSSLKSLSNLHHINHATKLVTLKQLLNDCGIGLDNSDVSYDVTTTGSVVSQHRVILFCQMKIMLDIIETDLFRGHMPSVSYLRLDGSVPASQRHLIVHRFNNDPSIDVLLLSTQVGGLGLNLTGADTVIFYDHDWNPMKDLQAMDRAHRIGQKKVVTVYRLITRGTLEEKIMGLQRFKLNIAQSVVNQDNHSLRSMGSNQLLDLFCLGSKSPLSDVPAAASSSTDDSVELGGGVHKKGFKSFLDDIGQLWDSKQYDEEYNLDNYVNSFAKEN